MAVGDGEAVGCGRSVEVDCDGSAVVLMGGGTGRVMGWPSVVEMSAFDLRINDQPDEDEAEEADDVVDERDVKDVACVSCRGEDSATKDVEEVGEGATAEAAVDVEWLGLLLSSSVGVDLPSSWYQRFLDFSFFSFSLSRRSSPTERPASGVSRNCESAVIGAAGFALTVDEAAVAGGSGAGLDRRAVASRCAGMGGGSEDLL